MGTEGFYGNFSEESKKALQSETWQKVRDSMKAKKEVKHFTAENTAENAYGWTWDKVVKEYLRSGYNAGDNSRDIVVMGEAYKTLRRPETTVFYDAAGDTLFDVTNERLKKEYEWLMNSSVGEAAENMDAKEEKDAEGEQETPEPAESKGTSKHDSIPVKQLAEEKLKKELAAAKDKSFAEPIIGYLLERCRVDEGLAEDVMQEHKTWQKCFDYIYSQAKEQSKGNCAFVPNEVVYEWAEDYYRKDDKAEEEKKAKEAAERKKKEEERKKKAAEQKKADKKNPKQVAEKEEKAEERTIEPQKPKKNLKEIDGQMDMFSMMGM